MTVQESKKEMEICNELMLYDFSYGEEIPYESLNESNKKLYDAHVIAIEIMEELEQYRALGTVEEIIKHRDNLEQENHEYSCLGTLEELKEAREKQVASKWIECPYADLIMCPSCNAEFSTIDNCTEQFEYCPKCGKKLE